VRSGVAVATFVLCATALAAPVHAQARRAEKKPTAWSQGVSERDQQRALQLFREGNTFFEQLKYTEAVVKYELALAAWDHPNIRFNMAICLINMRQPLVAWRHLEQALRFGEGPLSKQHYSEAKTYLAALQSSLAELTVRATQPEVTIMVDGNRVTPGSSMKLLAGKHQLVASRPGHVTESRPLDLPAGKPVIEDITLLVETVKVQRENYERRWKWWVPWTVTGSSIPLALTGTAFYLAGRSQMRSYDEALREFCAGACDPSTIPTSLQRRESAAKLKGGVGIAFWTGAAAAAITGGVMAVLNRPRQLERVAPAVVVSKDYVGIGISFAVE
jgi:tetratricopeptide (TPR) repeat protein